MLIVAQNLTFPKDELVSYVNEGSANAESNTSTAENSIAEPHKAQIIADNIAPSQEKTKAMVADNISYSKEDPKVNAKDILENSTSAPLADTGTDFSPKPSLGFLLLSSSWFRLPEALDRSEYSFKFPPALSQIPYCLGESGLQGKLGQCHS
ncbi:hypothetical protein CFP56_009276 [Quercus suber]|uniref:Uncharacterized protein n=1 Tax=Quercus suber TaxID=58331 RepID=A0AAW0L228_QUESU